MRQLFEKKWFLQLLFVVLCVSVCLSGVQFTEEKVEELHPKVFREDVFIAQLVFAGSQGRSTWRQTPRIDPVDGDAEVCGCKKVNKIFEIQGHLLLES